jgi:hypothetical protein
MSKDLVPLIFVLREHLNPERPLDEQVQHVLESLNSLERLYGDFDSLDIVEALRSMMSEQYIKGDSDINIRNHLQTKGFEPIKKSIISSFVTPIGTEGLHCTNFQKKANKKQKSGGFSLSFNFDEDFGAYEGVGSMLSLLRKDESHFGSLEKILKFDLSELLDSPQWPELLEILYKSFADTSDYEVQIIVMAILHRFMNGFSGSSQGLEAIIVSLRCVFRAWVLRLQQDYKSDTVMGRIFRSQLVLFATVLKHCPQSLSVPNQKEVDRAYILLFFLLAKGALPERYLLCGDGSDDSTSSAMELVGGASARGTAERRTTLVPLLRVLASTSGGGVSWASSLVQLVRAAHPLVAITYAVQTGLIQALLAGSSSSSSSSYSNNELDRKTGLCSATNEHEGSVRSSVLEMRLLLAIIGGFDNNAILPMAFISEQFVSVTQSIGECPSRATSSKLVLSKPLSAKPSRNRPAAGGVTVHGAADTAASPFAASCSTDSTADYMWCGDLSSIDAAPVYERNKSDIMSPVSDTNKRFLHLVSSEHSQCSVVTWFRTCHQMEGSWFLQQSEFLLHWLHIQCANVLHSLQKLGAKQRFFSTDDASVVAVLKDILPLLALFVQAGSEAQATCCGILTLSAEMVLLLCKEPQNQQQDSGTQYKEIVLQSFTRGLLKYLTRLADFFGDGSGVGGDLVACLPAIVHCVRTLVAVSGCHVQTSAEGCTCSYETECTEPVPVTVCKVYCAYLAFVREVRVFKAEFPFDPELSTTIMNWMVQVVVTSVPATLCISLTYDDTTGSSPCSSLVERGALSRQHPRILELLCRAATRATSPSLSTATFTALFTPIYISSLREKKLLFPFLSLLVAVVCSGPPFSFSQLSSSSSSSSASYPVSSDLRRQCTTLFLSVAAMLTAEEVAVLFGLKGSTSVGAIPGATGMVGVVGVVGVVGATAAGVVVDCLRVELEDIGTWDRAYAACSGMETRVDGATNEEEETAEGNPFSAVLNLLLGLVRLGHHRVVGELLHAGWALTLTCGPRYGELEDDDAAADVDFDSALPAGDSNLCNLPEVLVHFILSCCVECENNNSSSSSGSSGNSCNINFGSNSIITNPPLVALEELQCYSVFPYLLRVLSALLDCEAGAQEVVRGLLAHELWPSSKGSLQAAVATSSSSSTAQTQIDLLSLWKSRLLLRIQSCLSQHSRLLETGLCV